jgi:hypothetical protein
LGPSFGLLVKEIATAECWEILVRGTEA